MSGEHGEPWHVNSDGDIEVAEGCAICTVVADPVVAERIKACVNALDGVTTAAIEVGAVRELVEALRSVKDRLDYLQNLWGKEGVTNRVIEMIDAALKPFADS